MKENSQRVMLCIGVQSCCAFDHKKRPTMPKVLETLEQIEQSLDQFPPLSKLRGKYVLLTHQIESC